MTALATETELAVQSAFASKAAADEVSALLQITKGVQGAGGLPVTDPAEVVTLLNRLSSDNDGTVPSASQTAGVTVSEKGDGVIHKTVLTLTNVALAVTFGDDTVGGHGTLQLYDFPAGHIKFLGGHQVLGLAAGAGGIADDAVLDAGVGSATVSAADETLATTEQNIVTKADITLSGGAAAAQASINSTDLTLDGSSTAIDAHLNVAVTAADITAHDTITLNGTITLHWLNLGDD